MGYYAAVMHFGPAGLVRANAGLQVGGDATYLPNLTAEDQKVGFNGTKPENTNFCPVFPRARVSYGRGPWSAELGYVPPVAVCGVEPHMLSVAVTRRRPLSENWALAIRASTHIGRLDASITCNEEAVQDASNPQCFQGQVSNDRFAPFSLALEGAFAFGGWSGRGVEPYVLVGLRRDHVRFDVNFIDANGTYDSTRLVTTLYRVHIAGGASWSLSERVLLGGEVYYAPLALLTVRTRAAIALGSRR